MKKIYRYYSDIEIYQTCTNIKCPYCGEEWCEVDKDQCGKTYEIECEECGKTFEMHFDAD